MSKHDIKGRSLQVDEIKTVEEAKIILRSILSYSTAFVLSGTDLVYADWVNDRLTEVTPVSGALPSTKLGYKFTVMPNIDSEDETIGVTGMTYNTVTNEYVFSYYAFEREAKLWIYGRNSDNLLPYTPSGTLTPTPDRQIDVSEYLHHIQGVAFDDIDGCYYILGAINPVSANTERILIKVDDNGNLIESTNLSSLSFQAGMLALNNAANQLIIKPNDSANVYFLNKDTKALERTEVAHTIREGLAYDIARSALWIGGDEGQIKVYDYDTFDIIYETSFETLPNESSAQNIEGMCIDPVDDRLLISFDAYLHGTNNNGNCMWKFDFPQMVYANAAVENPFVIKADWEDPSQPKTFGNTGEDISTLPSGNFATALSSFATGKPFSTAAGLLSFGLASAAQSTRLIGGRLGDDNLWFSNGLLTNSYRQIASREWAKTIFDAIYESYVAGDFTKTITAAVFGELGESIDDLPGGTFIANISSDAIDKPYANVAGLISFGGSPANNLSARILAAFDGTDNFWFSSGPRTNDYRQFASREWVTQFHVTVNTDQDITAAKIFRSAAASILAVNRITGDTSNAVAIQFMHNDVLSAFVGASATNFGVRADVGPIGTAPFRINIATGDTTVGKLILGTNNERTTPAIVFLTIETGEVKYRTAEDVLTDISHYVAVPFTPTSTGTKGQKAYDDDYIYECIATDTWARYARDLTVWDNSFM